MVVVESRARWQLQNPGGGGGGGRSHWQNQREQRQWQRPGVVRARRERGSQCERPAEAAAAGDWRARQLRGQLMAAFVEVVGA